MQVHSVSLVTGMMFGVQYEELEGENYVIIALGIVEIILTW